MTHKLQWLCSSMCILLFINSCNTNDNDPCANVEPNTQFFSIELVDADGNNLIENNIYNRSDIQVLLNGNIIGGVPDTALPTNYIVLELLLGGDKVIADVMLSVTETDKLTLSVLEGEPGDCGFTILTVTEAIYNGFQQNITLDNEVQIQKIIVVK
ncbi:hypothetical protein [Ascidiimonas sp. W6]|uniref:hypothetical protein n=1 Tax=Ascidiimonas meishanensis TaxID=3128903 RepID=UPI0030EDA66C